MAQLWDLAQAQASAQVAVEQLVERAKRSRVHKQTCHDIAHAGIELFKQLEAAARGRTGDIYVLCSAAARLSAVVNSSRACVEQYGNPSRLSRLTAAIFPQPRKIAVRALLDQYNALQQVAGEFSGLWASTSLRVATGGRRLGALSHSPLRHQFSDPAWFSTSRNVGSGAGRDAPGGSLPVGARNLTNALSSPLVPCTPLEFALSMRDATPRVGSRAGVPPMLPNSGAGGGPGSELMPLSPSCSGEEGDALRSMPFAQRSVRPSDNNPVQRLCFMRGAGGESAAVQLMVVLNRQVEVYSAALDSFHSDTPLDFEAQQVTSTGLYEPTIDLITGHRGGTVLVYGRVGAMLSASASTLRGGVLSAAAEAATAAQQAGVPLVIRLSRGAVTALHCVPAIELEAATVAAAAATVGSAADAPALPSAPSGLSVRNAGDDNNTNGGGSRTGGAAATAMTLPTPCAEAIASGAVGCCTADDVLLFTGDSVGRVMAVRYSRVQPEVLATTVFTIRRAVSRATHTPPSEQPNSLEITGLLYRSGCLLVSTATDIYSILVIAAPQQATANGHGSGGATTTTEAEGSGASGGGDATRAPGGTNTTLTAANGGGGGRVVNGLQGSSLPQSTSINLLSPAGSAMPVTTRGGGVNAIQSAPASGGGAVSGGGAAAQTHSGGSDSIIRRGSLQLSTTLAHSFHFADLEFDSCTALVAIDWPTPGGGACAGSQGPNAVAPATAAAVTPRGSGALGGGLLGSPEGHPSQFWASTNLRGEPPGGAGSAPLHLGNAAPSGVGLVAAGRTRKFVAAKTGPWRMLSAHMNGQLLMWNVTTGRLQLICAIGQPGPPIMNVFTFPELGTMVELLSTGHVRVGPLPTSALAPPISPLGNVPVWQFGRATLRVHRGRLTAGAALANCIATGSRAGGVKVHNAAELREQAVRQNVAFLAPWPVGPAGAASGRSVASASPTASVPYPASDHVYNPARGPVGIAARSGGGPCNEDPPYGHGGPPVGPSGAGSLVSTAAVVYPSPGGTTLFSRMPSGHTIHSIAGVPSSNYPFMPPQVSVPGGDAFGHGGGYPLLHSGSGPSVGGVGPPPHQRVPGPSAGGAGGEPHHMAMLRSLAPVPVPAQRSMPAAPQPASAFAITGEGPDAPSLPARHVHHPLPNGLPNGLANGNGHGPRSEDSMGNLSPSSSVANTGPQVAPKHLPPPPPQRSMTGLRSAGGASGLARVSERPAGDTTPTRPAKATAEQMTATERAVAGVFGVQGAVEEASTKLPPVLPAGYDSDEAAAGPEKPGAEPPFPAAGQDRGLAHPNPQYRPPPPHHHSHPYTAPPSPTPTSALPNVVVHAAAVDYGTSAYGNSMPPPSPQGVQIHYPVMPTVGTDALPPPPLPHLAHTHPSGGLVATPHASPKPTQTIPWTVGGDSMGPSHGPGYNSPSPAPPGHQMYGNTSPMPPPSGVMVYPVGSGVPRSSDYGGVPMPLYPPSGPGGSQHVPGPQLGAIGRRMSGRSEYDTLSSMVTGLTADDLAYGLYTGTADDMVLPPPPMPVVKPPPPCDPTAPPPKEPQLSQNCFIRPEELRNIEQIGEGAEGIVYRGRWHHIDVAVKEMHPSTMSFDRLESMAQELSCPDSTAINKDLANLIKEVAALIDLGQHPNIIRFIGVCASPPRIVTEYYKMGSLFSLLKEARRGNMRTRERLAWDKRLIMLKDIAAGMAYLHSRDYIHGDLRSPNVFVTEDQHLKIGDFGFARILGKAQNQAVPARLTNPRWQAPEVYDMAEPIATTAADVYSFGIIMYEMLTFRLPYDDEPHDDVVKLRHTMYPSWRPHIPPDRQLPVQKGGSNKGPLPPLQAYKTLMMDCWAENPSDRPGFHKIASRLNALCNWQWALSQIQRGLHHLHFRQRSRARNGNVSGPHASAEVTPSCVTPTSVSSPTHTAAAAAPPTVPPQELNRILDEVATTLEEKGKQILQRMPMPQGAQQQGQQQGQYLERHAMQSRLHDEQPFTAVCSPAGPPSAGAGLAAVLPLLPLLPPLRSLSRPSPQPQPQPAAQVPPPPPPPRTDSMHTVTSPQHYAAGLRGGADSPTRLRPTPGFAGRAPPESGALLKRSGGGVAAAGSPEITCRLATVPTAVVDPPDLETAPTLASSGSRPLQVSAAGMPPRFTQGVMQVPAPGGAAAPPAPLARSAGAAAAGGPVAVTPPSPPSSPPAFPAVRGGDGHALMSPFQSMRLSDDEEEDSSGSADRGGRPTAACVAAIVAAAAAPRGMQSMLEMSHSGPQAPPSPGLSPKPPACTVAAHYAGAPPSPLLGTASSVAPPAAPAAPAAVPAAPAALSMLPLRFASAHHAPQSSLASVAPQPGLLGMRPAMANGSGAPIGLTRHASFQPSLAKDPLEMHTAFHMGVGFSIEDDEDDD